MNPLIKLQDIYICRPCIDGWSQLLAAIGYESCRDVRNIVETKDIFDGDKKLSLGDIAISNDVDDALWCVRALDWDDVTVRRCVISSVILPAVKRTSTHTSDERVTDCITALQQWCDGDDTVDLAAVAGAATSAAGAADAYAAYAAASAAEAAYTAYIGAAYDAATNAAAGAAAANATAAGAYNMERERQRQDIIAAFPPVLLLRKDGE